MKSTFLLAVATIAASVTFAASAHAGDVIVKPNCGPTRVCVKWAKGAPGTLSGPCTEYKMVYAHSAACARKTTLLKHLGRR